MTEGADRVSEASNEKRGILYLVSLPIGNLQDITLRALDTLRSVDFILAEDTRHTRRLLSHFQIETPFFSSLYQGAERQRIPMIVARLLEGRTLALVSDAGTPLISDPGFPLVRAVVEHGIPVVPIPGASAGLAALVASGLPTDRFLFVGLMPRKIGDRRSLIEQWNDEATTIVAYESPHRLVSTLEALAALLPDRPVVLARELTKVHEEFLRGTSDELLQLLASRDEVRGECVLVIGPSTSAHERRTAADDTRLLDALRDEGLTDRTIARVFALVTGRSKNEAYREIQEARRGASAVD